MMLEIKGLKEPLRFKHFRHFRYHLVPSIFLLSYFTQIECVSFEFIYYYRRMSDYNEIAKLSASIIY